MNAIATWLFGQAVKLATQAASQRLFNDSLLKRLMAAAEEWRGKLSNDARLDAIEALLPRRAPGLETPPPAPVRIFSKIEKDELPSAEDWSAALLAQWQWVSATIEEPQAFFRLDEKRARAELSDLGRLLSLECEKDRELFQVECLKNQRDLKSDVASLAESNENVQRQLSTVLASLSDQRATVRAQTDSVAARGPCAGAFHGSIDAAVAFTQRGEPRVALAQLEALRNHSWDHLTSRERFRVVANIGHAYNANGQYPEAARHFIECVRYQPDDEQARCLAAIGHLMAGDSELAFRLAAEICVIFPRSDLAHATWVRSAPESMPFVEIELHVPRAICKEVESAHALSCRALNDGNLESAEQYARIALICDKAARPLREQLAITLLEAARRDAAAQYSESPHLAAPEKVEESVKLFMSLLDDTPPILLSERARIRFYLGVACQLLGKWAEAYPHLQAAFDFDSKNTMYARQFAMTLCDREEHSLAIRVLRAAISSDDSGSIVLLLTQLLGARNEGGDRAEALELLLAQLSQLRTLERPIRSEIVGRAIDLLCLLDRHAEAEQLLVGLTRDELAPAVMHAMHAHRFRRLGDTDAATREALAAAAQIGPEIERCDQRRIAAELTTLGLVEIALPIWKKLVEPRYIGLDTRNLLHCALRCDDASFIMEFCARLRANGVVDREVIHLELNILQEYHCFAAAIELMCTYLDAAPETKLAREIRLRLSHLAIVLGRTELVEFDPTRLPSPTEVEPDLGLAVVEVLSHGPEPAAGVRFAYELLRRHFDSHFAHKAMVSSFLFGRKKDLAIPESDVSAPGFAVRYKEDDSDRNHWHIIEDSPSPEPARNEFPVQHGVSKLLLGKRVGEQFYLRRDRIQERTATITEIRSKYRLRFNLCMEEWENRFPEHFFLWKFAFKKDAEDTADFDVIFKSVDQQISETERRDELYRTNPLSITNFAMMVGCSVLDAVGHISNQPKLPIRCCRGTDDEFAIADASLNRGMGFILDGSALATLFVTKGYRHLSDLGISFVVSEGTLQEWRRRYIEKLNSPHEGGFLTKSNGQYIFITESAEALQKRLGEFREFVEAISSLAHIEDGAALAGFDRETRQTMTQILGRPAAETIAIASNNALGLWTDDMCVAAFAAEHGTESRVWTDGVFRWGCLQGRISVDFRNSLVVSLLKAGYFYTRVDLGIALWAGDRAGWCISDSSFGAILEWLSNPYTKREGVLEIAGGLLLELSRNASPFRANNAIAALLTRIMERPDGRRITRTLHNSIDVICGVNVMAANALKETFAAWDAAR